MAQADKRDKKRERRVHKSKVTEQRPNKSVAQAGTATKSPDLPAKSATATEILLYLNVKQTLGQKSL